MCQPFIPQTKSAGNGDGQAYQMPHLDIGTVGMVQIIRVELVVFPRILGDQRLRSDVVLQQLLVHELSDGGYQRLDKRARRSEHVKVGWSKGHFVQ